MTPGVVTLRTGDGSDREFVLDLGRRTIGDSISSTRHVAPEFAQHGFEQLVAYTFERSYLLVVAETSLEGRVGYLLMLEDLPDEVSGLPQAFVAYMAVEPHARRLGVAARLLEFAENAARARGLPHVALMVTEGNEAAREFYAQAGFTTERRLLCKTL